MIVLAAAAVLAVTLFAADKRIAGSLALVVVLALLANIYLPVPCSLGEILKGGWILQLAAYGTQAPGCTL
jgi:hypothetical protein